ncbi:MAG TPA: hypothetical protein VFY89_01345, partial [Ktedonobacterales bacterium]
MTTAPQRAQRSANQPDASDARNDVAEPAAKTGRETRPLPAIDAELGGDSHESPQVMARADIRDEAAGPDTESTAPRAAMPPSDAATTDSMVGLSAASLIDADAIPDEFPDEIPDESDGWAVADQPTVVLSPQAFKRKRPDFLQTGEQAAWPPPPRRGTLGDVTPPIGLRGQDISAARPSGLNGPQLASPDGEPVPSASEAGMARTMMSNPRMHRFQELRRKRVAQEAGEPTPDDGKPVAEVVRQWWSDLRPGLERALRAQHEARASGLHPIPAHDAPAPRSRLGDAFGYIATSARELADRASKTAAPRLKQLHDRAERAAQALIQRFEGSELRQQGPL